MATSVKTTPLIRANELFEDDLSSLALRARSSPIRELLSLSVDSSVISFAGGFPDPKTVPTRKLGRVSRTLHRKLGREFCRKYLPGLFRKLYSEIPPEEAYQYGATEGIRELRETLATYETESRQIQADSLEGMGYEVRTMPEVRPEHMIVVAGSQQGLYIVMKLFLDDGDPVVVSEPTYVGALQAFNEREPAYVTCPATEEGFNVDAMVEQLDGLDVKPKFIYVVPDFENPTGYTTTLERRIRLLREAKERGIIVVSDTPYRQLRFEGEDVPELGTLNHALGIGARLIEMKSSSKILAPLRLGYMMFYGGTEDGASDALTAKASVLKQPLDLCTSNLLQAKWHEFIRRYGMDETPRRSAVLYGEKKELMRRQLSEQFGDKVKVSNPQGGMFLCPCFPEGVDTDELLRGYALEEGVAFIPGTYFSPIGGWRNGARLNFTLPKMEQIKEGCSRLGRAYRKYSA